MVRERMARGVRRWWGRANPDPNIGLVGDGDEIDAVEWIEKHFKIALPDKELERMRTIGQLFEMICARRPDLQRDTVWVDFTRLLYDSGASTLPEKMQSHMMFFDRIYD